MPDALFGIEHQSSERCAYRFYGLEVERHNPLRRRSLDKPSTLKKLLAYQSLLRSGSLYDQLSLPNLFLIIATNEPSRLLQIARIAEEVWDENERKFLLLARPSTGMSTTQSLFDTPTPTPDDLTVPFVEITQKWFEHFQP